MRAAPFRISAIVVLVVLSLGSPALLAHASPLQPGELHRSGEFRQSADQQALFEAFVARAESVAPLVGPLSSSLLEDPAVLSAFPANVTVENFHASADFVVPTADPLNTPWDIGFIFGGASSGGVRVVVDSLGTWATSVGSGAPVEKGQVPNLLTRPGDTNRLDLFVIHDTAMLGVNGQVVAQFYLPAAPGAGDVGAGSAFFDDQLAPGRGTDFMNFTVRTLVLPAGYEQRPVVQQQPAIQVPAQGSTQTLPGVQELPQGSMQPQPAPASDQISSQVDDIHAPEFQQQYAALLTQLEAAPPTEGPSSFQLVEDGTGRPTILAGMMTPNAGDFIAVITFVNPTESLPPWTAGLAFRSQEQVLLTSTGHVLVVHQSGAEPRVIGEALSFDPTPGARNTLEVFAIADEVLVGVNGVPVAVGPLTDISSGMGVALIAGIIPQDQVANRVIAYEDYRLWYGAEIAPGGGQG